MSVAKACMKAFLVSACLGLTPTLAHSAPTTPSEWAEATRPHVATSYDDPTQMIENADMAAFMTENRSKATKGEAPEAWGYAVVDMLAAGEAKAALRLLEKMPDDRRNGPLALTRTYLRPWALAADGRLKEARAAMDALDGSMDPVMFRGHRALLLEGAGRSDLALEAYNEGPEAFDRPGEGEPPTQSMIARALVFETERILALRKADLLIALEDNEAAIAEFDKLLEADPNDAYARARRDAVAEGVVFEKPRSLKQVLAIALSDQAGAIEERQLIVGAVFAQGRQAPFNHFTSSLRQTALVLAPENADLRAVEADNLHRYGHFEAARRLALGGPATQADVDIYMVAARSALQINDLDGMQTSLDYALDLAAADDNADLAVARLSVASVLVDADRARAALALISDVLDLELDADTQVFARMVQAEAAMQTGDLAGAVAAARAGVEADPGPDTRGFLAAMLVQSSATREEGLGLYADLFSVAPRDPSLMNNYGYGLVENPASADELDQGFRLLRQAHRLRPHEANLLDSLGWAYYQYGDYITAVSYMERAAEAFKPFDHWEIHDHLGDVYWRLGRRAEARQQWRESLAARPHAVRRASIEGKLKDGLTTPEPEQRTPPEATIGRDVDEQKI